MLLTADRTKFSNNDGTRDTHICYDGLGIA